MKNVSNSPLDMNKLAEKHDLLTAVFKAQDEIKIKDICYQIGQFYLSEYDQNGREEVEKVGFVKVEFGEAGKLNITVRRPGLFIGKRGENVEKLGNWLGRKIHIIEAVDDAENWVVWGTELINLDDYDREWNEMGIGI